MSDELFCTFTMPIHSATFKVSVRVEYPSTPLTFTITEVENCEDNTDWTMILDLEYVERLILSRDWEMTR